MSCLSRFMPACNPLLQQSAQWPRWRGRKGYQNYLCILKEEHCMTLEAQGTPQQADHMQEAKPEPAVHTRSGLT